MASPKNTATKPNIGPSNIPVRMLAKIVKENCTSPNLISKKFTAIHSAVITPM